VTTSTVELLRHRLSGRYAVDPWGHDPELIELIDPLFRLFVRVRVDGAEHLPADGPAVLVASRRFGVGEPVALIRGISRASGRHPRVVGLPDLAPAGPVLRRLGGAIDRPEEIAGLLRAGELVALPLSPAWRNRQKFRAGHIAPESLAPALAMAVPVIPAAVIGGEITGRWRVVIGQPVRRPVSTSPLALAELAERAREAVQALLDEAFPPRWVLG
jgi:hypothetical protein